MMKNKKGFTLIELLVVIAIIGLLSTLAVVSLNGARAKARDAKRVSDVRQMASIIEIEAGQGATSAITGCIAAHALTTTCTGPGDVSQFTRFADPTTPGTACLTGSAGTCGYSIAKSDGTAAATVSNYEILFYLEQANPNITPALGVGINCIKNGAVFNAGAANCL